MYIASLKKQLRNYEDAALIARRAPNIPINPDRDVERDAVAVDDRDDDERGRLLRDVRLREEEEVRRLDDAVEILRRYSTILPSSSNRSVGSSSASGKSKKPMYPGIPINPCESLTITVIFSSFSTCQRRILERNE